MLHISSRNRALHSTPSIAGPSTDSAAPYFRISCHIAITLSNQSYEVQSEPSGGLYTEAGSRDLVAHAVKVMTPSENHSSALPFIVHALIISNMSSISPDRLSNWSSSDVVGHVFQGISMHCRMSDLQVKSRGRLGRGVAVESAPHIMLYPNLRCSALVMHENLVARARGPSIGQLTRIALSRADNGMAARQVSMLENVNF